MFHLNPALERLEQRVAPTLVLPPIPPLLDGGGDGGGSCSATATGTGSGSCTDTGSGSGSSGSKSSKDSRSSHKTASC